VFSSPLRPTITFPSVEDFTFAPFKIALIVFLSRPVCFVAFLNPRAFISAIKLLFAATRPPS